MSKLKFVSSIVGVEVANINSTTKKYTFCATTDRYHNKVLTESYTYSNSDTSSISPMASFMSKLFNSFNKPLTTLIFYRSGVNQFETSQILKDEILPLKEFIKSYASKSNCEETKFSYVIVNKLVDIKFFDCGNNVNNPNAGLCVDNVHTSSNSYEYYIQPQFVNQGTATPTKFSVLYDSTGCSIEELEEVTYNMCFYYWNWSGAIRVPSVLKFAELCNKFDNMNLGSSNPSDDIRKSPYFI